jgi:outer membrane immunogenic protein
MLLTGSAFAADPAGWSGFYLGATGGGGFGTTRDVGNPDAAEQDLTGALLGVTAGYNAQVGGLVFGIEADLSGGGIGKDWAGNELNPADTYYGSDTITGLATIRGRIGYDMGGFMPYVTGGLAVANMDHTLGCDAGLVRETKGCGVTDFTKFDDPGKPFETANSAVSAGFVAGAGLEVAVSENISLKGEYLYGDLGTTTVALEDPFYPKATNREFDTTFSVVRLGLNFRF